MIKLAELLHVSTNENNKDLVIIDDWPFQVEQFLTDMGFKSDGIYHFSLKSPEIIVSYNKNLGYILDDRSKNEKKSFKLFDDLMKYFENYKQKWKSSTYL